MTKVIIVDDEESVRIRILKMMEKWKNDFSVLDCFSNGFDVIESGFPLEPDIIITDIKMSYINGIELMRQAKLENPLIKFIIVSGYDSFDYAKEAISLGAVDYLTKPVEEEELKSALYKAKKETDDQAFLLEVKETNEKRIASLTRLEQWNDFERLITMKSIPEKFSFNLKEDGIDLSYPYQCLFIIDTDDEEIDYEKQDLLFKILEKLIDKILSSLIHYTFYAEGMLTVLLLSEREFVNENLFIKFSELLFKVKKTTSSSISIGVSEEVKQEQINYRKIYRHARRALEYRTIYGKGVILYFSDLEKEQKNNTSGKIDENEYKKITYLTAYRKIDELKLQITRLIETISTPEYQDSYHFILFNILNSILKASLSLSDFYQNFESQAELTKRCYSLKSKEMTISFFLEVIDEVDAINEKRQIGGMTTSFERIIKFIDLNYLDNNLSIEDVANELGFSVSYITVMLKKNNTTFTKLLTSKRMSEAKTLLSSTDETIINIAEKVGYNDPYYFSHCFRKYTGDRPDDFRKKAKK